MERYESVKVGNVVLGDGIPRICVPVVAADQEGVLKEVKSIRNLPADLAEWRIDWLKEPESAVDMLPYVKAALGEKPLLVTFRTKAEGGQKDITPEAYVDLYELLLKTGMVDLLDVELFMGEQVVLHLIHSAHEAGCKVILSSHEFGHTPSNEEMLRRLCCMQVLGADITKLAVMPNSYGDVLRLLEVTTSMRETYADRPFITMSMGEIGVNSRISGALTGSAVTFGSAAKASAPGQLEVHQLNEILNAVQPVRKKKHIYLIGFMGSGKSTIARALSKRTGMTQMEMDERIVELEGRPITEIFAADGEAYFRQVETALLTSLKDTDGQVVSCGGGVPMRRENVDIMKESGTVVLLNASPRTILERVKHSTARPILNGHMNVEYIQELMEKRRPAYEAACDICIDTDGKAAEDICQEILAKLSK